MNKDKPKFVKLEVTSASTFDGTYELVRLGIDPAHDQNVSEVRCNGVGDFTLILKNPLKAPLWRWILYHLKRLWRK